jgi:hypothetical protein
MGGRGRAEKRGEWEERRLRLFLCLVVGHQRTVTRSPGSCSLVLKAGGCTTRCEDHGRNHSEAGHTGDGTPPNDILLVHSRARHVTTNHFGPRKLLVVKAGIPSHKKSITK